MSYEDRGYVCMYVRIYFADPEKQFTPPTRPRLAQVRLRISEINLTLHTDRVLHPIALTDLPPHNKVLPLLGLLMTVIEWVRALDWRPDGRRFESHFAKNVSLWNFGNSVHPPLPVSFGGDTKSRRSLLSGVYARGSKRSHESAHHGNV